MRLAFEEVKKTMQEVLTKHGCSQEKAAKTAHEMARNSLEGTYTHGINRFARLVRNIEEGIVKPEADPEIIADFGGMIRIDGHLGLGVVNAWYAMDQAIEKAKTYGIGLAALKNTNHWMRAATYGYQACDAGMAGICFTNTMPNMPTWGAVDSRLGNNPIVFAFPRKNGHLIVDAAMSQFSYGALELACLQGRQMAVDAGFDEGGNLTRDPAAVIKSRRILPTGYWKGAALSFMLDIFASACSGGNSVSQIGKLEGDEHGVSQIFLAINYKALVPEAEAEQIAEEVVSDLLASQKDANTERITYAGQRAGEARKDNEANGIPVDERVWKEILSL